MDNREKYIGVFCDEFEVTPEEAVNMTFENSEVWDSVTHMSLTTALEDEFEVEFEPEELLAITSFDKGIEILQNKGIVF